MSRSVDLIDQRLHQLDGSGSLLNGKAQFDGKRSVLLWPGWLDAQMRWPGLLGTDLKYLSAYLGGSREVWLKLAQQQKVDQVAEAVVLAGLEALGDRVQLVAIW